MVPVIVWSVEIVTNAPIVPEIVFRVSIKLVVPATDTRLVISKSVRDSVECAVPSVTLTSRLSGFSIIFCANMVGLITDIPGVTTRNGELVTTPDCPSTAWFVALVSVMPLIFNNMDIGSFVGLVPENNICWVAIIILYPYKSNGSIVFIIMG